MRVLQVDIARLRHPFISVAMILMIVMGCTASNFGRLESNPEVTQAFEAYQILPDHTYYFRGSESRPIAIAGIHETFSLDSPLWVKIDTKSNNFRAMVGRVSQQGSGITARPWGFTILDKSGRNVGVWYSAIRAAAVDVDESGRIVNLSPIRTATIGNQGGR